VTELSGVLIVDKPVGPTSFAVVRQVRNVFGVKKVGHGGTLDPLASGVLPVCLGEATKLAQFLLDADKEYLATIQFGAETDTDDRAGAVTATHPVDHLREADVAAAVEAFRGERTQIPPMFSALKHQGRPLYDYARAGEVIAREARHIEIMEFELLAYRPAPDGAAGEVPLTAGPAVDVRVRCSKGTYIRTLARDLGAALGSGAHLAALRRTRSGPFDLGRAVRLEQVHVGVVATVGALISPADALIDMPAVHLTAELERIVSQGKSVTWERLDAGAELGPRGLGGLTRLLVPGGALVAVARRGAPGERVRTLRVFATGVEDTGPRVPSGQAANPEV
jgi:tRNA pseudouridine55 synthase